MASSGQTACHLCRNTAFHFDVTAWLRKNPWFEAELLPVLREKVDFLVA